MAISGSDYYAQIRMAVALAFNSKYALSLYELGTLYLRRRDPCWSGTVEEFRSKIGVPDKIYKNFAILRREVLAKSKLEIDQLSDFVISWKEIRGDGKGRPVRGLEIRFEPKDSAAVNAAADELDRPEVGRIARRDGTVEQIVRPPALLADGTAFPKDSLHFCPDTRLTTIVVDIGGGWDRDVIAEAYRSHMGEKLETLRGNALYKSFEGFCRAFVAKRKAV